MTNAIIVELILILVVSISIKSMKKVSKRREEDKEKLYTGIEKIESAYDKIKDINNTDNNGLVMLKLYCLEEIANNSSIYRRGNYKLIRKSAKLIDEKVEYVNNTINKIKR